MEFSNNQFHGIADGYTQDMYGHIYASGHFLEMKTNIENHSNGKVKYIETIAIIEPMFAPPKGYIWIRIGENRKFDKDGRLLWHLEYDEKGNVIN